MLGSPFALLGLAAIPALLAVYLLRNKVKQRDVSSLMLWAERRRMTHGGSKLQRNRLPILFFLELLIILLLILAAASPRILSDRSSRPLVIILDNSASMAAIGPDGENAAQRALRNIPKQIRSARLSSVRVILAGRNPRWLDRDTAQQIQTGQLPPEWKMNATEFNDEKAILFARENSTPSTRILVVSDTPPEEEPASGTLKWLATGRALPNAGFVNAVRNNGRCMIEITGTGTTQLTLKIDEKTQTTTEQLPLRKTIRLADPNARFEAELPADALDIDNRVILLPEPNRTVPVLQSIQHPALRKLMAQTIDATGLATVGNPELFITDATAPVSDRNTWILHIVPAENAQPFTGPFVVDYQSPLTSGLSFEGVVWAASANNSLPGMPIIMAGNIPLLTRQEDLTGRTHFYLQIDPELSTLPRTPAWPTLLWNLLQARATQQPGFADVNLRQGMDIHFTGPAEINLPDRPGILEVQSNQRVYQAAINFLDAEESTLSRCRNADLGSWIDPEQLDREYADLSPLLILLALTLLCAHQFLIRREARLLT
jgi:hypothetical protein